MTGTASRGGLVLPAALLLLLAGCLLQILAGYSDPSLCGHAWGTDDAYISYRYARNLAAGEGLVFNPGAPGERVEGFSNLLYVLLLTPAAAVVSPDRLYAVSAGLNLLLALAALIVLHRFARRRLGPFEAGAVTVLLALCPSLWVAVASGLETPLVLLIQLGTWVLAERLVEEEDEPRRLMAGLAGLAALAVLARADGFITPALAVGFLVLRGRWRTALAVAAAALATFGAVVLFRLSYYGWPLPNTYYAKITSTLGLRLENGWQQLLSAALGTGFAVYLAAFLLAGARALRGLSLRRRDLLPGLPFPVVFAAGWLVYYLYIGGDVFYDRFLLFLFPMGAFLLFTLATESRRAWGPALLAVLLAAAQLVALGTDARFRYNRHKYDCWVLLGRALKHQPPGSLLAVDAAGKIPYFSGLPTLDMLGLNDAHIGHEKAVPRGYFRVGHAKTDLPYIFSRRPALIAVWLRDSWELRPGPVAEPEACERQGYRLAYLLNTDQRSKGERDLLDVRGMDPDEIRRLAAASYRYGVFAAR
jgi:arabinofuranosyltransferase